MESLTHLQPLTDAIARVRQRATAFHSNFFAKRELVEAWIGQGALSCSEGPDGLLIFRKDRNFYRLYHVAADTEALSGQLASLGRIPRLCDRVLVSDLVGRPQDIDSVADVYEQRGFRKYGSLFRMVNLGGAALANCPPEPDVMFATAADVQNIREFLERQLDPFVDQIPDVDDLDKAVARGNILVVRRDEFPAGVLIFEKTGLTAVLRYWYVSRHFQGHGIGAGLIRAFFRLCREGKRIVLWVASANADSIAKYRHYGFEREQIEDQIMMREA